MISNYHQNIRQFGSRSGQLFCQALPVSKLFAKATKVVVTNKQIVLKHYNAVVFKLFILPWELQRITRENSPYTVI